MVCGENSFSGAIFRASACRSFWVSKKSSKVTAFHQGKSLDSYMECRSHAFFHFWEIFEVENPHYVQGRG